MVAEPSQHTLELNRLLMDVWLKLDEMQRENQKVEGHNLGVAATILADMLAELDSEAFPADHLSPHAREGLEKILADKRTNYPK